MASCKSAPLGICISPDQHFSCVVFVLEARAFPALWRIESEEATAAGAAVVHLKTSKGFAPSYWRIWQAFFERADTVSSVAQDQIRDFVASYFPRVKWIRCCVDDKRFKTLKCKDVVDMHRWGHMQLPGSYMCINQCLNYVTREPPKQTPTKGILRDLTDRCSGRPERGSRPSTLTSFLGLGGDALTLLPYKTRTS